MMDMSMTQYTGPIDLSVNESDWDILLFMQYNGIQACYSL